MERTFAYLPLVIASFKDSSQPVTWFKNIAFFFQLCSGLLISKKESFCKIDTVTGFVLLISAFTGFLNVEPFFDKLLWMWRYNCKQLKILENWSLKERQPQNSYFSKFDFLLFLFCLIDMFSPSLSQSCDKKKIQKLYEQFHKTYNHGNKLLPKKFTWLLILPIYHPWCIIKVPFLLQVYIYDVTKMMMVIWKTWRN